MRKRKYHDILVNKFRGNTLYVLEFNPVEYAHPETLIRMTGEFKNLGELDYNIEVIYLNDVILLQENGGDSLNNRGFIWYHENWADEVVATVDQWQNEIV